MVARDPFSEPKRFRSSRGISRGAGITSHLSNACRSASLSGTMPEAASRSHNASTPPARAGDSAA